jgi:hypothetical protein
MQIRVKDVHVSIYKASNRWMFERVYIKRNKYFSLHLFKVVLVVLWNNGVIYDI